MRATLKPPVAEEGPTVHGGGNRRDWFLGGRGEMGGPHRRAPSPSKAIPYDNKQGRSIQAFLQTRAP